MASGHSTRYGTNKPTEDVYGYPLVGRSWDCVKQAGLDVVVVTRFPEIARLAEKAGFRCVLHDNPLQSATIRLGLQAGEGRGWEGCLFLSGDQPLVTPDSIRTMCDRFSGNPDEVYRLAWKGQQQKPVLFPKRLFSALQSLQGDSGGSAILRGRKTEAVEAGHEWELWDVDRPEDLERVRTWLRIAGAGLPEVLGIPKGITAVIGSGGKTTLLRVLAGQLKGKVILCTSTHIFPFSEWPLARTADEIGRALADSRAVCAGAPADQGRLTAPPVPFSAMREMADYVLVEADGSARRPLKAHAPWEPVIPEGTDRVLGVIGASGFLGSIRETVHRPEIFCRLAAEDRVITPGEQASPEMAAAVLRREALADTWILNQADAVPEALTRRFAAAMPERVIALSLRDLLNR